MGVHRAGRSTLDQVEQQPFRPPRRAVASLQDRTLGPRWCCAELRAQCGDTRRPLCGRCGMLLRTKEGFAMPTTVEDLAAQALGLPPGDRAKLVERLIASFEPRSASEAAWLKLAQARRDDVRSGNTGMVPGDEALERVRARIA